MTMIGSLLRLQSFLYEPEMVAKLQTIMERIVALATVHPRLYQSGDVTRFDIASFVESLASDVIASRGRDETRLEAAVELIEVPSDFDLSVGLILNEIERARPRWAGRRREALRHDAH